MDRIDLENLDNSQKERQVLSLNSGIPFISGCIMIPYSVLPMAFIICSLLIEFIFELPLNFRVFSDFFWTWFAIRFFASTGFQIGEPAKEFAFSFFFPKRMRPYIERVSVPAFSCFRAICCYDRVKEKLVS